MLFGSLKHLGSRERNILYKINRSALPLIQCDQAVKILFLTNSKIICKSSANISIKFNFEVSETYKNRKVQTF